MRDPNRIKLFLDRLQRAWEVAPDLRFTQLFCNVFREGPYNIEDHQAIEMIEKQMMRYRR
jgi:uncharacterized protein YihD (DUF1040 family)